MTVLGTHHVGLGVADLAAVAGLLREQGFDGDPPFVLDGADAARGNGVAAVDMEVAFVSNGAWTIELISHRRGAVLDQVPAQGAPGYQEWQLLRKHKVPAVDLPGVGLRSCSVGQPLVVLDAADPGRTGDLLRTLGLEGADGDLRGPGMRVRVRRAVRESSAPPANAHGRSHVALRVRDAGQTHALLRQRGFDCVSAPIPFGDAIAWFFVRDPGGSGEIEIVQDDTV